MMLELISFRHNQNKAEKSLLYFVIGVNAFMNFMKVSSIQN